MWDITENTRLDYYGLRVNPWDAVIDTRSVKTHTGAAGGSSGSSARTKKTRKLRLSLSPLVNSVVDNLDDDVRNVILSESFKRASPELAGAGREQKKEMFGDALKLPVMDYDLPVVNETRALFMFVSGGKDGSYDVKKSTVSFVFNGSPE